MRAMVMSSSMTFCTNLVLGGQIKVRRGSPTTGGGEAEWNKARILMADALKNCC